MASEEDAYGSADVFSSLRQDGRCCSSEGGGMDWPISYGREPSLPSDILVPYSLLEGAPPGGLRNSLWRVWREWAARSIVVFR